MAGREISTNRAEVADVMAEGYGEKACQRKFMPTFSLSLSLSLFCVIFCFLFFFLIILLRTFHGAKSTVPKKCAQSHGIAERQRRRVLLVSCVIERAGDFSYETPRALSI